MSDHVIVSSAPKHAKCQHFGMDFDRHDWCRKCTVKELGSLHSKHNYCQVCVHWSSEQWARYLSPLPKGTGSGGNASEEKVPKKHKGRSKKSAGSASTLRGGKGEAPASVASATSSTVSPDARNFLVVSEPVNVLPISSVLASTHTGAGSVAGQAVITGAVDTTAAMAIPFADSALAMGVPPVAQSGVSTAPWLQLPDCETFGASVPPVLTPQSVAPVASQASVVSTRGSSGLSVTASVPVTTTATMGSRPLVHSAGGFMADPGSHQGLPYMVHLMQMLHGMQGQPQYSYPTVQPGCPVPGYVVQPPVPVTGRANVVTGQGNYLVQSTMGSIPATGSTGHLMGNSHTLVNPPGVSRLPRLSHMAAGSTIASSEVSPHTGLTSQSASGGSRGPYASSLPVPSPMEVDNADEDEVCAYSSSCESSDPEDIGTGDLGNGSSPIPHGVRAAFSGPVPAQKVAFQTANSTFRSNLQLAMKFLPQEAFPPLLLQHRIVISPGRLTLSRNRWNSCNFPLQWGLLKPSRPPSLSYWVQQHYH